MDYSVGLSALWIYYIYSLGAGNWQQIALVPVRRCWARGRDGKGRIENNAALTLSLKAGRR
jgi:hypothetical protein